MNQLHSVSRLHAFPRNVDTYQLHGSRNHEQRGPVIQTFPGPNMTNKMYIPGCLQGCGHGLRTSHLQGNPTSSCNRNPGCNLPRK